MKTTQTEQRNTKKNPKETVNTVEPTDVWHMETDVQGVGELITSKVCRSVTRQMSREVNRESYRSFHETCQGNDETEVSARDITW